MALAFDDDARLSLSSNLYCSTIQKSGIVKFFVDTGSGLTILSLFDAERLGVRVDLLPHWPKRSGGYGGKIELRALNHIMLMFAATDGSTKSVRRPAIAVQYSALDAIKEQRMVYSIPSIIGTDVLTEGAFTLRADWPGRSARLEWSE